jgi:hypothetical protein
MNRSHARVLAMGAIVLLMAALVGAPAAASASATAVTMTGSASPTAQPQVDRSGAALALGFSAFYDNFATSQQLREAVFHLDNDFAFDATGLPACPLSSIEGKFHNQAVAACSASIVGSGTASVNDGDITAVLDAFHGGGAFVYVQMDVGPGATVLTLIGTLGASTRGGDFGTQLDLTNIPNTPGLVFTQFDLNFRNQEQSPGHHYVSARCEPDKAWEFAGDFEFYDTSTFMAATNEPCQPVSGPTGRRAAALKRCKKRYTKALQKKRTHDALTKQVKKHLRTKFKKCKKTAEKLPV